MEQQVFTRESLTEFDGTQGRPAYVAYQGKVYDVSESALWADGDHWAEHQAGADLTAEIGDAPHSAEELENFPIVGTLRD